MSIKNRLKDLVIGDEVVWAYLSSVPSRQFAKRGTVTKVAKLNLTLLVDGEKICVRRSDGRRWGAPYPGFTYVPERIVLGEDAETLLKSEDARTKRSEVVKKMDLPSLERAISRVKTDTDYRLREFYDEMIRVSAAMNYGADDDA